LLVVASFELEPGWVASDGDVYGELDTHFLGARNELMKAPHVEIDVFALFRCEEEVDALGADLVVGAENAFQDRKGERGTGRGRDEDERLVDVPPWGRTIRARHKRCDRVPLAGHPGFRGELMHAPRESVVFADNQFDAVAEAGARNLVCGGYGVGMCLSKSNAGDPEIQVLAGLPLEMYIRDG